jgi:ABC-type Fe3+ transport system permease subunit
MSTEAAAAIIFGVLQVSISVVALWQQHRLYQDRQRQRTSSTTHNPDAELISGQRYGSKGKCIWIRLLLFMMFLDQRLLFTFFVAISSFFVAISSENHRCLTHIFSNAESIKYTKSTHEYS